MDQISIELAQYLVDRIRTFVNWLPVAAVIVLTHHVRSCRVPPTERFIVGIAGVPASGKSTLSRLVFDRTIELLRAQLAVEEARSAQNIVALVGLDGWHYTRAQLDAFPDPKLAHDRRGAHWTFDGEGYVEFVQQLRRPLQSESGALSDVPDGAVIYAPSFSHELKDPTPNAISITPRHRLVIIEGLYPFLDIEPWIDAGKLLDERWWVEIGEDEAKTRLVARHVVSGVAKDWEEAEWRARENDAPSEFEAVLSAQCPYLNLTANRWPFYQDEHVATDAYHRQY